MGTDRQETSARGKEVIECLIQHGRALGYDTRTEYPVVGGRIDVVWLTRLPGLLSPDSASTPLVGFEIESSKRSRKHIKGDYLNLHDLGAAVGVIVLLGDGPNVESTRQFARILVERPGPRILIWTDVDLPLLTTQVAQFVESGVNCDRGPDADVSLEQEIVTSRRS
jgi:hypothetical protein